MPAHVDVNAGAPLTADQARAIQDAARTLPDSWTVQADYAIFGFSVAVQGPGLAFPDAPNRWAWAAPRRSAGEPRRAPHARVHPTYAGSRCPAILPTRQPPAS